MLVGWGVGSRWAGLYVRSVLVGELFIIFSAWLTPGGAAPSESARPQMSKNKKIEDTANTVTFLAPPAFLEPCRSSTKRRTLSFYLELGGPLELPPRVDCRRNPAWLPRLGHQRRHGFHLALVLLGRCPWNSATML